MFIETDSWQPQHCCFILAYA